MHATTPPPSPALADLPNPFVNEYKWNAYSIFKAAVCLLVLVPIRVLVIVLCGLIIIIIGYLGVLLHRPKEDIPMVVPRWQERLMCCWMRGMLFGFGFWWIRVTDERRDKKAPLPPIIVANHTTLMDPLFLGWYFAPSFVAFRGVEKIPVMGALAKLAQCIYVQRDDPNSRALTREAIQQRVITPGFRPLVLFPEGMCTNGKCLITFRLGAFGPGVPILPVMLKYPYRFFNPSTRGAGKNPFMMALQFANNLEVTICEPYIPSDSERASPELYANNVRNLFMTKLGVPGTRSPEEDAAFRDLTICPKIFGP